MDKNLTRTGHLATLDGMRGMAALIVVLFHVHDLIHLPLDMPHTDLAVDFFFILSGFVIAKAYEAKLLTGMSFPHFVIVRLTRLYPMVFCSVILGAVTLGVRMLTTHALTPDQLFTAFVTGLFLFPTPVLVGLYSDTLWPINGALWSLFFELVINFIYAPLVKWLTTRLLAVICVLSGLAMLAATWHVGSIGMGWGPSNFFYGFPRVTYPFFTGILLYRFAPRFHCSGWLTVLLLAVLTALLMMPYLDGSWLYEFLVLTLAFPPMVYAGAVCRNGNVLNKICLWLGELSYPLYLVHFATLRIATNALSILHIHLPLWGMAIFCCLASVAVAEIARKLWDEPVRRWLNRRARKGEPGKPKGTITPGISAN